MGVEDRILDKIQNNRGKELLYKRARETISSHSLDSETYKKNILALYLGLCESEEIVSALNLPKDKVKDFKQRKQKRFFATYLANENQEENEANEDTLYDTMDRSEEAFLSFQERRSYTRESDFREKAHLEDAFHNAVRGFNIESFLFNRMYEMMVTQLLEALLQEELGAHYTIKVLKTSTYDDTISGVDMIVTLKNKHNQRWSNVGIDHICGTSQNAIDQKAEKSKNVFCAEFSCAVKNFQKIPRIVRSSNPGISFLLFEYYIQQFASGTMPDSQKLAKVYYEIIQAHPKLYEKSLEKGLGVQENIDTVKESLLNTF